MLCPVYGSNTLANGGSAGPEYRLQVGSGDSWTDVRRNLYLTSENGFVVLQNSIDNKNTVITKLAMVGEEFELKYIYTMTSASTATLVIVANSSLGQIVIDTIPSITVKNISGTGVRVSLIPSKAWVGQMRVTEATISYR